jgi:hypothetical protein
MDLCIFKSIKLRGKKKKNTNPKGKGRNTKRRPMSKAKITPKSKSNSFSPSIPHTSDKVTILSIDLLESHSKALH